MVGFITSEGSLRWVVHTLAFRGLDREVLILRAC